MRALGWWWLMGGAMALGACSSSSGQSSPDAALDGGADSELEASAEDSAPDGQVPPVQFGECPQGYSSECAILSVPLDYDRPEGEHIDLHIARLPSTSPAVRQLWILAGGPGEPGEVLGFLLPGISQALPNTDIYVIDHRGTGYSHRLTCPEQDVPGSWGGSYLDPTKARECLEHLKTTGDYEKLPYFNTTQAAKDLAFAIESVRQPGQQVIVWGQSYGSYWAHRYLQLATDQPDAIAMDGFMTPGQFWFVDYEQGTEESGVVYANGCVQDDECHQRFGDKPLEKIQQILEQVPTGPCKDFLFKSTVQTMISVFLDAFYPRGLIFPLLHRVERCNADDRNAISHLLDAFFAGSGEEEPYLGSGILQYNIILSEIWAPPGQNPTEAELNQQMQAQTFHGQTSFPGAMASLREFWPLYSVDVQEMTRPVTRDIPLLWLGAGLDVRTPPSQALLITSLYNKPNQPYINVPGAAHLPSNLSPVRTQGGAPCGMQLIDSFVLNSVADTTCLGDLVAPVYHSPSVQYSQRWWGVDDGWGDGQSSSQASTSRQDWGLEEGPRRPGLGMMSRYKVIKEFLAKR